MTGRFAIVTTGRAGSTSLLAALGAYHDIAVPAKQIDCPDNEIFRRRNPHVYWSDYERLSGLPIHDDISLARAFYLSNAAAPYAGFKTMPNRHRNLAKLLADLSVQAIALIRRDIPATIASFLLAIDSGNWRRPPTEAPGVLRYTPALNPRIDSHLVYLLRASQTLASLPHAIRLSYEDLCTPNFDDPELQAFFGRRVTLPEPRAPLDPRTYVEGWPSYESYVTQRTWALQRLLATP